MIILKTKEILLWFDTIVEATVLFVSKLLWIRLSISQLYPENEELQKQEYPNEPTLTHVPLFKHGFLAMHGFTFMIFNKI